MFLKRFLQAVMVLAVLLLVLGIALFVFRGAIEQKVLATVDSKLTEQGIHLAYTPENVNLLKGLTVNDATLYRTAERKEPMLKLSTLAISYKFMDLISEKKRLILATADDAVLTAFHEGEPYNFENLDANLQATARNLRLSQLDGQFFGLNLEIEGDVAIAEAAEPSEEAPAAPNPDAAESSGGLADLDFGPLAQLAAAMNIESKAAPPTLKLKFSVAEDASIKANGSLAGEEFVWDGLPVDALKLDFATKEPAEPLVVTIDALELKFGGRPLSASGEFDTEAQILHLNKLDSKVDVIALTNHFAKPETPLPLRFLAPPHVVGTGTFSVAAPEQSALSGTVQSAEGVEIDFPEDQKLTIAEISTNFALKDGILTLPDFAAKTLDGAAGINAAFRPFDEKMTLDGTIELNNLSLDEVTKFVGQEGGKVGRLSATFEGKGAPEMTLLNGNGTLTISEAELLSIPIFRKLKPVLSLLMVGPFEEQSKGTSVTATYALNDGVLATDDIKLVGSLFEINGTANVNFGSEELLATAAAKTRGATQLITGLAGKALEIEASGTFGDYSWKPKNLPGLEEIGSITDIPKEKLGEMLQGLTGSSEDAAAKAVDDISNIAKEAKEAFGGLRLLGGRKEKKEQKEKTGEPAGDAATDAKDGNDAKEAPDSGENSPNP